MGYELVEYYYLYNIDFFPHHAFWPIKNFLEFYAMYYYIDNAKYHRILLNIIMYCY